MKTNKSLKQKFSDKRLITIGIVAVLGSFFIVNMPKFTGGVGSDLPWEWNISLMILCSIILIMFVGIPDD